MGPNSNAQCWQSTLTCCSVIANTQGVRRVNRESSPDCEPSALNWNISLQLPPSLSVSFTSIFTRSVSLLLPLPLSPLLFLNFQQIP